MDDKLQTNNNEELYLESNLFHYTKSNHKQSQNIAFEDHFAEDQAPHFKGKEQLSFEQEDEYLIKGNGVMNDYQNLIEQEGLNDEMQGGSGQPMSESFSSNLSDGQHKKYSPKLKSAQMTN